MHDAAPGRHPLHAARLDDAFMAAAIAMREIARQDEGHGFEAAMGVGTKGQAAIAGRIGLRAVVIEE